MATGTMAAAGVTATTAAAVTATAMVVVVTNYLDARGVRVRVADIVDTGCSAGLADIVGVPLRYVPSVSSAVQRPTRERNFRPLAYHTWTKWIGCSFPQMRFCQAIWVSRIDSIDEIGLLLFVTRALSNPILHLRKIYLFFFYVNLKENYSIKYFCIVWTKL